MTALLSPSTLTLRPPHAEDAATAGRICYIAFKSIADRHSFPPDFPTPEIAIELMNHLFSRADVHAVIADCDGRVIGSNFLWEDGQVAGVGPVTVDPARQNGSIGRQLMDAVLRHARQKGIPAIRLVQAAYHARSLSLYTKLGFVCREPLAVMQGNPLRTSIPGRMVRAAVPADQTAIDTLCRRVHGHTRSGEVKNAIQQNSARVVLHDSRVVGYTTGIGFFGHSVSETTEDMRALIAAAPSFPGLGFFVPIRNAALFRWCLERGLRVVEPMTLMSMGPYSEPEGAFLPSILY
jgi:GNAT superfamily N-acetyltransferase